MELILQLDHAKLENFRHMIPEWILNQNAQGDDIRFYGMWNWDIPCGVAAISPEGESILLRYIYITQDARGVGRGTRLLQEILLDYHSKGYETLEAEYLPKRYPQIERLLTGFPVEFEWESAGTFQSTLGELQENKHLSGQFSSVRALNQCTEEQLHMLCKQILAQGDDLVDMPVHRAEYDARCSALLFEKDKPVGMLLAKASKEEGITIPFLVSYASHPMAILELFRFSLAKAREFYPKDTSCQFTVVNDTLFQLLSKLGIPMDCQRAHMRVWLSQLSRGEQEAQQYMDRCMLFARQ